MANNTFLLRDNTDGNPRCAYIELDRLGRFECRHYFASVNLTGASWSGKELPAYKNIETVLSEAEYNRLIAFAAEVGLYGNLGCGIKENDERYERGVALLETIQDIIQKLRSNENDEFFSKIQESEIEAILDEYRLDEEEVREIFDYSPYGYKDRDLISCIWDDEEELGREHSWSCGYVKEDDFISNYIDFEKLGSDLADDEGYFKLSDGRIVQIYM